MLSTLVAIDYSRSFSLETDVKTRLHSDFKIKQN